MAFDYKTFIEDNPLLKENEELESNRAEQLAKKYNEVLSAFITFSHVEYNTGLNDDDILDFFKWAEDGDYDFHK